MPNFLTIALTLRDYYYTVTAPLRSFTSGVLGYTHHKINELPKHKECVDNTSSKTSRNIYLTDLDDTFIDWEVANRSQVWKLQHRLLNRPTNEEIKIFDNAENFIHKLNKNNVHTAVISNKSHDKLISQAAHHSWGGAFDRLFGHDRRHAITMAKMPNTRIPSKLRYSRTAYPLYIIKKLLNETPALGMEPVNVVFVGDRLGQDVKTANLLDRALKRFNPESSCTSVLFNSRKYESSDILELSTKRAPKFIVNNYDELEKVTDIVYSRGKDNQPASKNTANHSTKDEQRDTKTTNWIDRISAKQSSHQQSAQYTGR